MESACANAAHRILMKLKHGVNFINILRPPFSYKSELSSFSLVTNPKHSFVIFGTKILYKKPAHKTLMKLTPGDSSALKRHLL